ncbi:alpha/beta hydrolase family protein [Brevibacillus massiliensis]|jgi:dipeptidyl aminopeptidase/acylaminoacyl peptidase|uniref:alpha/beta hydrolase family protein n=1 Tax=Brevibacillus massiliensis TaxID=1118054 RepID=UPI000305284F|nr:prolyl oligopeptidase family serine peptidase [Brevibacillus massiliensis]
MIVEQEELEPVQPGVRLYTVTYESQGLRVKAAMAVPDGAGPFPALLYCRGGMKEIGKVRVERISQMAAFGYLVFAPHYRGNEGTEGRDEFGGAERHDVYAAFDLLKASPWVLADQISLYGFSRGGMMALLAAIECPGFHSAVIWAGVCDLFLTYQERVDLRRMLRRVVGHPVKNRQAYLERSPVYRAGEVSCPVLIIHGTEDENVSKTHAVKLAEALAAHNKPHELWLVEGAAHLFDSAQIQEYTVKMFDWLRRANSLSSAEADRADR